MKHVTWNDIIKLGTMNPIVQKNLDELGEMPGITHAYALMAMVDELDGQLARFRLAAWRYSYLRDALMRPRSLDVLNNDLAIVDGHELDQAIDAEMERLGLALDLSARIKPLARDEVLATLRGAGFTDTAETLATLLDDIAAGKTGITTAQLLAPLEVAQVAPLNKEFERAPETSRRQAAVKRLLELGYVWNGERWNFDYKNGAVAKNEDISGEKVASDKAEG